MVLFDDIEEIFQEWRNYNEYSKALVTLATALATILIFFFTLKLIYRTIQLLRLYVCSQMCCKVDFVKKYGKWAVITGSTDGIGLAMAKELARRGHSILVVGRNDEKLARTKVMLEEEVNVGEVETIRIDLSDSSLENYERIRDELDAENRDIGILINNAGVFDDKFHRFLNADMKFLLNLINVNILATLHFTKLVMPGMLNRQKGLIVNVSSVMGDSLSPFTSTYGQTKTFINAFTHALQAEYSSHPIDIINLTPGPVHTKLFINTNTIKQPTFLNPSPEDYAKSAINAIQTNISDLSGTFSHEIMNTMGKVFTCLGLTTFLMKSSRLFYPDSLNLSPVMKRKKISSVDNSNDPAAQQSLNARTIET